MAKRIKVAATSRKCGALPENIGIGKIDASVIAYINEVINALKSKKPDLIVFPEMCDLPEDWSMEAYVHYIAKRTDIVYKYVRTKAKELHAWIAFSTVRQMEDGSFRNSCILIDREGSTQMIYDKMHPTLGELEVGIRQGNGPKVLDCELGRVGAAICFDLNYLELALEYQKLNLNLLLFPALFHGGLLQQIWAYTTRSYLIGACGGCGASIVSPIGEILERSAGDCLEVVYPVNMDFELVHLDFNRDKLADVSDKYTGILTLYDPGNLGCVIIKNESNDYHLNAALKEFEIEKMDDYLERMKDLMIKDTGEKES